MTKLFFETIQKKFTPYVSFKVGEVRWGKMIFRKLLSTMGISQTIWKIEFVHFYHGTIRSSVQWIKPLNFPVWQLGGRPEQCKMCFLKLRRNKQWQPGGFKHFLFLPLLGEMIQFDEYFSNGLKTLTRQQLSTICFRKGAEQMVTCARIGYFWISYH